jgi:Rrf2 family protein
MLSISRQTDYACRVILHLAMLPPGERATTQDIARRRLIPRALVRRVITQLANAQLILTTRGSNGGLSLARPSKEISLLDVVQVMEGPLALNACAVNPEACPLMQVCSVHEVWVKTRAALVAELSQATFDKLAQRGAVLSPPLEAARTAHGGPMN